MIMKDSVLLDQVIKPGRYIGMEHNAYHKTSHPSSLKVCLCFPDIYDIGMSTFGLQILYSLLNEQGDILCDRAYFPWEDMRRLMIQQDVVLSGLETEIPLNQFDIVGFSISYEMNYTNVLGMLGLGRIPLFSKERKETDPIVIAGGGGLYNPEPLGKYMDAIFIGEAEEAIVEITTLIKECRHSGTLRMTILERLAQIEGVYVPSVSRGENKSFSIQKRYVRDFENTFFPTRQLVPLVNTVHCRAQVEVMRGCPWGCFFCQAGSVYGPVRTRSKEKIVELVKKTIQDTGYEEISLLSLSSGTFSDIEYIIAALQQECRDKAIGISLPSLRIEKGIETFPQVLSYLKRTGLTLAPEAGSVRLRTLINKKITIEHLKWCVAQAYTYGWKRIKLYFMIGLPTETYADLDELCDLVNEIARVFKRKGKEDAKPIVVSISNFIPKPHTPLQWCAMERIQDLFAKQEYIKKKIDTRRVKVDFHNPKSSYVETILSRGDSRIAEVLYEAYQRGLFFQAWDDYFSFDQWTEIMRLQGIDADTYVYQERLLEESLPWEHIQGNTPLSVLKKIYGQFKLDVNAKTTPVR